MDKLCSLWQRWGVLERWTNYVSLYQRWGSMNVGQTMFTLSALGSMNGGQIMLTLSALGVHERWTNYVHFVSFGCP